MVCRCRIHMSPSLVIVLCCLEGQSWIAHPGTIALLVSLIVVVIVFVVSVIVFFATPLKYKLVRPPPERKESALDKIGSIFARRGSSKDDSSDKKNRKGSRSGSIFVYKPIYCQAEIQWYIGCHINSVFYGYFLYADDIIVLSPSGCELQVMLDNCYHTSTLLSLRFNHLKFHCVIFGKSYKLSIQPMMLGFNCIFSGLIASSN